LEYILKIKQENLKKKAETQNKTEIKSQTQNILRNTHKEREREKYFDLFRNPFLLNK